MECCHLEDAVNVSPEFIKRLTSANCASWSCSNCESTKTPWICLKCGEINCGRYVNGHAKSHHESTPGHSVCMDASLVAFCYVCDDFVINDTPSENLQLVRNTLQLSGRKGKRLAAIDGGSSPEKRTRLSNSVKNGSIKLKYAAGLKNLGNTCFMNAILQSLSNLNHFRGYFKDLPAIELNQKSTGSNGQKYYTRSFKPENVSLVEELRKVLCALWQGTTLPISPDDLFSVIWKVVPRFRGYQQHDAHEFMHYLLDRVHCELLQTEKYSNGADTIVTGIFGGDLQSEVNCLVCHKESKKTEPYLDLSLDVPIRDHKHSRRSHKGCQLSDCLQSFVNTEVLDESERYVCEKCKQRQPSTKKFWLRRLPNVLCLHLKRFRYTPFGRSKVDTYIKFPLHNLDMNPYVLKKSQSRQSMKGNYYDLGAVVVHHGSGTSSGHYTTYARHEGSWYDFNDSNVHQVSDDVIARCKAYILFYTRRHSDMSVIQKIRGSYLTV